MPAGRPTSYTPELATVICERIAGGQSVAEICREPEMPAKSAVYNWLANRPEFVDLYARAREQQADKHFEEILQIADDGRNDTQVDDEGNVRVDHDHINRSRLRVDARKWVVARLSPRKYGDIAAGNIAPPPPPGDADTPRREVAKAIMALLAEAVRPTIAGVVEDAERVDDGAERG